MKYFKGKFRDIDFIASDYDIKGGFKSVDHEFIGADTFNSVEDLGSYPETFQYKIIFTDSDIAEKFIRYYKSGKEGKLIHHTRGEVKVKPIDEYFIPLNDKTKGIYTISCQFGEISELKFPNKILDSSLDLLGKEQNFIDSLLNSIEEIEGVLDLDTIDSYNKQISNYLDKIDSIASYGSDIEKNSIFQVKNDLEKNISRGLATPGFLKAKFDSLYNELRVLNTNPSTNYNSFLEDAIVVRPIGTSNQERRAFNLAIAFNNFFRGFFLSLYMDSLLAKNLYNLEQVKSIKKDILQSYQSILRRNFLNGFKKELDTYIATTYNYLDGLDLSNVIEVHIDRALTPKQAKFLYKQDENFYILNANKYRWKRYNDYKILRNIDG